MRRNEKGFTLIELMIVIAIIAIIAAIAIPGLLSSQRASNERSASTSLKTISSSQADMRANDRDGNRVNDFWTGDLSGLYTIQPVAADPTPIKLIELSLAAADGAPIVPAGAAAITTYAVQSPKAGYWYQSLVLDLSATGVDQTYAQTTNADATAGNPVYGANQNTAKFGFSSYPDSTSAGKFAFVLNENNTVFRQALTASVKASAAVPPTRTALNALDNYPSDVNLRASWSKLD